ncbi:MAG: CsbD family protein [Anaerolineae bacterium]
MDDIFEGNWKQIQGHLKEWWGDLTDDDILKIEGKRDRLVGVIQKKYGYTKERAETEVNKRVDQLKHHHA